MQKTNENFNNALKLFENSYKHEELIEFLKNGSVIERQFSALNLICVKSKEEAEILISNLVGVDGKIREAAALKIAELTSETPEFFQNKKIYKKFSQATIDIDGNVCRLAIISAKNISNDKDFSKFYAKALLDIINNALDEISKFTFRDKKYKINKQIFKIYWCFEGLLYFYNYADEITLKQIIENCSNLSEYTIREKCAKLVKILPNNKYYENIIEKLKNDENYYVRNIVNN